KCIWILIILHANYCLICIVWAGQHHYCCDDETTILHTRSKISWSYCPIKLIKHVFVKVQLFSLNAFNHQYKVIHQESTKSPPKGPPRGSQG
ncbi:hypothetical protein L9F63_024724, partial [Diploptera punctata]